MVVFFIELAVILLILAFFAFLYALQSKGIKAQAAKNESQLPIDQRSTQMSEHVESSEPTETVTHTEKTESTDVVAAPVTTDASQAKEAVEVESDDD